MKLDALHPYVAPYVIGCPIPVMDHNIRLSAIEFCNKTRWHEDELLAHRLCDGGRYEIDTGVGLDILRITSVSVDGKKINPETKTAGLRLIAAGSTERFFVVIDPVQIQINPAPETAAAVHVTAALRPTMTSTSLSDTLDEWREAIAGGAIARIAAIPKQDFFDPDIAQYQKSIFIWRVVCPCKARSRVVGIRTKKTDSNILSKPWPHRYKQKTRKVHRLT